jgi:hypothetical protein
MLEGKAHKQALVHLILSICHIVESFLLVVHLFVFGHVGFAAEVVKVSGVGFGVELRDKRSTLLPETRPVDLCKIGVRADLADGVEAG